MMHRKIYYPVLLLLAAISHSLAGEFPDAQFNQANIAYQDGDYELAVVLYTDILREQATANLHYNLGNAYFGLGKYGPSILHYKKALILDPGNPEFRANLNFVIEKAAVNYPEPSGWDTYAGYLRIQTWAWLASLSFWGAIAFWVLPPLYDWRSIFPKVLSGVLFCVFALSALGLTGYHLQRTQGIVQVADAPIRVAPAATTPPITYLPDGEFATIIHQQGDYYLVDTLKQQSGYIHQNDFIPIWN